MIFSTLKQRISPFYFGLMVGAMFIFIFVALAAGDDATVTGGDVAALPGVGVSSTLQNIVLTDTGGDDFRNDDVLTITLNRASYPGVVWDQNVLVGGLTVTGTCDSNAPGIDALTYVDAFTLTVALDLDTADCSNGQTISIGGLKVVSIYAAATVGAQPLVKVSDKAAGPASAVYASLSVAIGTQEATAKGMAFKSDGTKMYIVGSTNDTVYQYSLSSAWDVSSATYDTVSFSVASQDTAPEGISFKSDGTKMYIAGDTNNSIFQYSLGTAWDLSTASYESLSFSIASQDTFLQAVTFKSDGTKMYIMGSANDIIYQYSLSTAWNVSTASYDNLSKSVAAEDTSPEGMFFNNDGTKMYMLGRAGDDVSPYTLSTAWDVSTATFDSVTFAIASQEINGRDLFFKSDFTKMYIVGETNDTVYQYTMSPGAVYDSVSVSIADQETSITGKVFSSDGTKMYIVGTATDTVYQYSLSTAWDLSTATYDTVSFLISGQDFFPQGVVFKGDGTKMYIVGDTNNRIYQYSLGVAWDLSTASYDTINISVANEDLIPKAAFFKSDGTKMYIVGDSNNTIYQYSLGTAWNVSTATYDTVSFSVAGQETIPLGIFLNSDGTKMWTTGNSLAGRVYQYTLSVGWDLSTASYDNVSFLINTLETSPQDVFFKSDLTKMYIAGATGDKVYQFSYSPIIVLGTSLSTSTNTNDADGVVAADAAASITLADPTVGATQNTTVAFTVPLNVSTVAVDDTLLDSGDTVVFTMPAHIDVASAAFSSHTFDGGTFTACAAVGQVVTCTVGVALSDADGAGTIVLSGITSLSVASTDVTAFALNDEDNGGADVAVDSDVPLTDTIGFEDDHMVTGGNPVALPAVGATVLLPTLIVTDVDGNDFGQDPTTLRVSINTGGYPNVVFNENVLVGSVTAAGTCGYNVTNSVTYNSTTEVDVVVSGGTSCANGQTISVAGLQIATLYSTGAPGAAALVSVDNFTDNPGGAVATADTVNLAGAAGDADASITLSDAAVGASQNTTVAFTIPLNAGTVSVNDTLFDSGDTLVFTMPAQLNVSGAALSSHTFSGGVFTGCTPAAQVITCTAGTDITDADGVGTIVLSGIISEVVGSTDVMAFTLHDEDAPASGAHLAADTNVPLTDSTAGTLTSTNVQPASLSSGAPTRVQIFFTNPGSVEIAANDEIIITFPAGFNVTNAANGSCSTSLGHTMDGTFVTTVLGQDVILTRQNDGTAQPAGDETCSVSGIRNPVSPGPTGTYTISVRTSADAIRYTATVAADIIGGSGSPQSTISGGGSGSGISDEPVDETPDEGAPTGSDGEPASDGEPDIEHGAPPEDGDDTPPEDEETPIDNGVNTTPFTDLSTHWATAYVSRLYKMGVIQGRTADSFAPDDSITRAEILAIALRAFHYPIVPGDMPTFSDVKAGDWFAPYIAVAQKNGIVQGYADGTFHPNEPPSNQAEALKMILLAGRFDLSNVPVTHFVDVPYDIWFRHYIDFAFLHGLGTGDSTTTFAPSASITRASIAKLTVLALELAGEI